MLTDISQVIALPETSNVHHHRHHQIVVALDGMTEFELSGKGDCMRPGQGVLLASEREHAFCGLGDNRILVVNLDPMVTSGGPMQQRLNQLFDGQDYFQLSDNMQQLVQAMTFEVAQVPEDALLQQSCAYALVGLLSQHLHTNVDAPDQGKLNVALLDQYIEIHLGQPITVAQLAGACLLSLSQFHHLFRQQMGMTPQQYVMQKRIAAVKQALSQTNQPLAQIAAFFGFASPTSLSHAFRRMVGDTPAAYRRRFQGKI
ncbi:HTH-type transcriptional activator RhaS [Vibrio stylophorae]|uniref:HTH-type transcriptional activator RhaS n=1 Tax=Vibrio stylophorae TaxID=659351 RepID=A0ABN8DYW7_9VIBR|nr:AraC family transcriptional regulator [Vibrio stylophorae]CAH0535787.1 HTH-type transcriptional activator RhaS [Vibrio stylophorae]